MNTVFQPEPGGTYGETKPPSTHEQDVTTHQSATAPADRAARVAICICTCQRPFGLERTLRGVADQLFDRIAPPTLCVVIADNEGNPAARDVASRFSETSEIETIYVVEPTRGISHARNACLDAIPDEADFVAWLDDDEVPRPTWLEELLIGIQETGADAISGPQLPLFEAPTPGWIREGRFFAAPRRKSCKDGDSVTFGVMSNILFRASFLRQHGFRFDHKFALMGGEDRRFFLDVLANGGKMTWTSKAVADHLVSAERTRLSYVIGREFSVGCAAAFIQRTSAVGSSVPLTWIASVVGRMGVGILRFIPTLVINGLRRRAYPIVKNILDIVNLSGRLYGYFGYRYEHYR